MSETSPAPAPPLRWPATLGTWLLLLALLPVAAVAGFVFGVLAPLLWIVAWLFPF